MFPKFQYKHKPKAKDEKSVDPMFTEFFNDNDPNSSLIKDAIQNSLDSGIKVGPAGEKIPVKVRIFISDKKSEIKPDVYQSLLEAAMKHLKSESSGLSMLPTLNSSMRYMVYEDFNTTGLEGDPKLSFLDPKKKDPSQFYNFFYYFRNAGISGKVDESYGKWGIGKTVLLASSCINTAFSLTVRKSDNRELLMGETQLAPHYQGNEGYLEAGYLPYGGWGEFDESSYFCKPIENAKAIAQFKKLTNMIRGSEPGLSIFIPFLRKEINLPSLVYYVSEQYQYAIVNGDLEVELACGSKTVHINKETITQAISRLEMENVSNNENRNIRSKDELIKMVEFSKWAICVPDDKYYRLTPYGLDMKPRWNDKHLFGDLEALAAYQQAFEEGERIAVKIPLKYEIEGQEPELRWFEVYLEKDASLKRPDSIFIRGLLNLDHINEDGKKLIDRGPVRGMIVIRDPKLSSLFGDAEDVSHSKLKVDSRNFKKRNYKDGADTIEFARKSLKKVLEKLQKPSDGLYRDIARDIFGLPIDEPNRPHTNKPCMDKKREGNTTGGSCIEGEIPEPTREIECMQFHNGIRVKKIPGTESINGKMINLSFGYSMPKGKAVSNYDKNDFDLSSDNIFKECLGARIVDVKNNKITFHVTDEEQLDISITGFDVRYRNLGPQIEY